MKRLQRTLCLTVALLGVMHDARAADPDEVTCLAKNIYHEARGEPRIGQLAVASVTLNRVGKRGFRKSICGVVYQRKQFSWANNGEPPITNERAYVKAYDLAHYVITNRVRVTKATHYAHTRLDGRKRWMQGMERLGTIGRHVFYRDH